ncbi:MAG: cell division ATP-binding protein FtsE [candidate division WOR-3 bacterium]
MSVETQPSSPAVQLIEVSKYYKGEWPALTNINLTIEKGDFVFILGATGAGKTTLLRLLYRKELPDAGEIKVLGYDLRTMPEKLVPQLRKRLGIIFQDFRLLQERTVYENLEFVLRAVNTQPDTISARIHETLNRLGLIHKKDAYPHQLSGGEQQKTSIARALVKNPDIILADEPTGNIDPKASDDIINILKDINYHGTTVIMATHDAELIEKSRRRCVTLDAGRIVRDEG